MKKRFFAAFTALLLLLVLPLSAGAEELLYIQDEAGLLTEEETAALQERAISLRDTYQMDVVILTVDSLDEDTPQDYGDHYLLWSDYGYGDDYNAVLFLLSMEERDWYISVSGDAIFALTDYGIQACAQEALPYFAEEDYYGGFSAWMDVLPAYFEAFQNGTPIDGDADYSGSYYHGDQEEVIYYEEDLTPSFFLSMIIGLVVAAITVLIMRLSMNSKRGQNSASSYLKNGSFRIRTQQDLFLYSNVTKTARPKENSSGGGSSVHSTGGRKFGGGGGKF